jgi:phosphopantothenoylcysteine decarboxylase/phosphopantothenate--cysteine ligase
MASVKERRGSPYCFGAWDFTLAIYLLLVHCLVTAGPTYEPLDEVRRLTNFSTGQLGTELAAFLTTSGHRVTLLIGEHATYRGARLAEAIETFSTTADLKTRLMAHAAQGAAAAVFHAAAVSDFSFGKVWQRSAGGQLTELRAGKISTREGTLLAELVPTPKIISELRQLFPKALLVGWKFEIDGDRTGTLELAKRQLAECRTDACIANGPAYGEGFAVVRKNGALVHVADKLELFKELERLMAAQSQTASTPTHQNS